MDDPDDSVVELDGGYFDLDLQGASRGARLATLRRAKIALNRAKAALNRASLRAGQGAFGGAGARGRGARGRGGRGGTFGGRGRGRGWSNQAQPVDGQKVLPTLFVHFARHFFRLTKWPTLWEYRPGQNLTVNRF